MRLGILGGSFNPVHNGHLHLAQEAIEELNLDRVVFIPAFQSPFKLDSSGMEKNANKRIIALAEAVTGDPRFAVDDCEIKREGVSYTVDTLEDIITRYIPSGKPYLLIGDDLAADFTKWRNYGRILEIAEIVIGRREESDKREHYSFPHILLNNEKIDISSGKIRQLMKDGADCSAFIPSASSSPSVPTVKKIEEAARKTLSVTRFLHSRHTALLAYDMCRRFNIEPMDGYLAGIAHDLAKQLPPKEMLKLAKKDGNPVSALEKSKPNLSHGRAAAVLLKERFSIHNKDILEAAAFHTLPKENMRPLAKVIYIADKLEVSRIIDPGLRKMCYDAGLDEVFFTVLKKTVSKLKSKELDLSEDTLKLLNNKGKTIEIAKN